MVFWCRKVRDCNFLFIFFACPKKTNQKKRHFLQGIFNLRLKPFEKLCGLCPEFQSFFKLFCVKRNCKALLCLVLINFLNDVINPVKGKGIVYGFSFHG